MSSFNTSTAFFVALSSLLFVASGTVHQVDWSLPSQPNFYSNWSNSQSFIVGDTLVFNFATGQHNVATVSQNGYDNCALTSASTLIASSPANFTLNTTGNNYFICQFPGHCSNGQKLAINVSASTSEGSAESPASPPLTAGGSISPSSAYSIASGLGIASLLSAVALVASF